MKAKKIDKNCSEIDHRLYQPDTLNSLRNAWQRELNDRNKKINIKIDKEFERSRLVLASRRKQLTQLGKGNKPNATRPLTDEEVDKMYDMEYFGTKSP